MKEKKTKKLFGVVLTTIAALLTGQTAWATITGSGTQDNPYVISSVDDWNTFSDINNRNTYWKDGVYVKMGADIGTTDNPVTTMLGNQWNSYNGNFDGNGHTLTIALTCTDGSEIIAPFKYVTKSTIKHLHIAGTITTDGKMAGGFIGEAYPRYGDVILQSCRSSVTINASVDGDGTHGGLVAKSVSGSNNYSLTITDCLFDGIMTGSLTHSCGGFVGWNEGILNLNHCLQNGDLSGIGSDNGATFHRANSGHFANFSTCYYKTAYGTAQGTQTDATGSDLQALLGNGWEVNGSDVLPIMNFRNLTVASISGLQSFYQYDNGNSIDIGNYVITDAAGTVLNENTDYTVVIRNSNNETVTSITDKGLYTMTVTGTGDENSGYYGIKTITFVVNTLFTGFTPLAGQEADAQTNSGDRRCDKLVDGDRSTCWRTMWTSTHSSFETVFVEFKYSTPIIPKGYILTTYNELNGQDYQNPKDWILKARKTSNDEWTTLTTVNNDYSLPSTNTTDVLFNLENNMESYQYYRFEITATQSPASTGSWPMGLGELQLFGDIDNSCQRNLAYATISGLQSYYIYTGNPVNIGDYNVTSFSGASLNMGTDFYETILNSSSMAVDDVTDKGTYTLILTGSGNASSGCYGTKTFNITVSDGIPVTSETTTMTNNFYRLSDNVEISSRITITGTVELILDENKSLTASKGIELAAGNTLYISGSGTLTATGESYKSGIGAQGYGTLVINSGNVIATGGNQAAGLGGDNGGNNLADNNANGHIIINGGIVTATGGYNGVAIGGGNHSMPGDIVINGGQVTANTGGGSESFGIGKGKYASGTGGSLTLGWSNPDDFIKAASYNMSGISFAQDKYFLLYNTTTPAAITDGTTTNFANKKIVPYLGDPTNLENAIINIAGIDNKTSFNYTGSVLAYALKAANGIPLVENQDYTLSMTLYGVAVTEIQEPGEYTIFITGMGNYNGTKTVNIFVSQSWSGEGTESSPYLISNRSQLDLLARRVNAGSRYVNSYFKLANDIVYTHGDSDTENNYTAIGTDDNRFWGTFDGDGKTISGIRIYKNGTGDANCYQGIFGYVREGTVKNLNIDDMRITAYNYVGGIVGYADNTTIENCHASGSVIIHSVTNSSRHHGGIVGIGTGGSTVRNCTSAVHITVADGLNNNSYFGGIAGTNMGTIENCISNGVTVAGITQAGAIVGQSYDNATSIDNYYLNCSVGTVTSNIGTGSDNDIDGVRGLYTLSYGSHISAAGETFTINNTVYYISGTIVTLSTDRDNESVTYLVNGTVISGNTFTMPTQNVTITATWKKLLIHTDISVDAISNQTYDGNEKTPSVVVKDGSTDITNYCDVTYSDNINAGTATVTITAKASSNDYDGSRQVSFTIDPIEVTLTANSGTETYDGTEKSVTGFTCSVDGLTFTGVSASRRGTNAGTYTVSFSSGLIVNTTRDDTGNYLVTAANKGTLTINPASVTLTANSGTETYNGSEQTVTGFTSSVNGLTFTGVSASGSGMGVGTYDVTFTGITINTTKDDTGNYVVTGTTNGTLTINPYELSETDGITSAIATMIAGQQVKFTRTFKGGQSSTVCLPFDITADDSWGKFYGFVGVDKTTNPTWTVTLQQPNTTSLTANTPYLFVPVGSEGADKVIIFTGTMGTSADIMADHTDNPDAVAGTWSFIGTYQNILWSSDDQASGYTAERAAEIGSVYGFAASPYTAPDGDQDGNPDYTVNPGDFVKALSGASIAPFRAYLKYTAPSPAPSRTGGMESAYVGLEELPSSMTVVLLDRMGNTTAVGSLDTQTGELRFDNDVWYTIDGRKLEGEPALPGTYINGTRKVIIK